MSESASVSVSVSVSVSSWPVRNAVNLQITATNDHANQGILQTVRQFDPNGERTLGIITKPDMLPKASGSEAGFLELAKNKDVFFKLGWHVIKNRKFEERDCSIEERNFSEMTFFNSSVFGTLPEQNIGVDALRVRLSKLLFVHVKNELPHSLEKLGHPRSTVQECRGYLAQLGMSCHQLCKAGLEGNYSDEYFKDNKHEAFAVGSTSSTNRLRAMIQYANNGFAKDLRLRGHKYLIYGIDSNSTTNEDVNNDQKPIRLPKKRAMAWARNALLRTRGMELSGNFNPHVIAELFWEQCAPWQDLAMKHIERMHGICTQFLTQILTHKAPNDIKSRFWSIIVADSLKARYQAAVGELGELLTDNGEYPRYYDHYYTETLQKRRQERSRVSIEDYTYSVHPAKANCSEGVGQHISTWVYDSAIRKIVDHLVQERTADMETFSCKEALDCLLSIYKAQQKVFLANVTTQVIERHIVRGLEELFSPLKVMNLPDSEVMAIVSEPDATKRQRAFLTDRAKRLQEGQDIFRGVMGSSGILM
ncbi:hypothetical protein F4802DRAFT_610439 [Xylaria palmicola]|nr:hypothetical protein F4802DRAFT_610439 [Xylaria palmicola]